MRTSTPEYIRFANGSLATFCGYDCQLQWATAYQLRTDRAEPLTVDGLHCVACHECGRTFHRPAFCQLHPDGPCPATRWEGTRAAATFAARSRRIIAGRRMPQGVPVTIPDDVWDEAADTAQFMPDLSGPEIAALVWSHRGNKNSPLE